MLKPSSAHLMFLDLKHPLEQGSAVAATLQFEKAGTAQVEFPIAAIGASAPGAATGGTTMYGGGMIADEALRLGGHENSELPECLSGLAMWKPLQMPLSIW